MNKNKWSDLLSDIVPLERIKTRYIDLIAFASDASFYHLIPKAVVQPVSVEEIRQLFAFSKKHAIPITFRAGGTSLSGQSITDGILVDLSKYWRKVQPEENGKLVRVQPGITGAMVNASLKKYSAKIGPDPSSINAAMMGGILANNSSGMCCGVTKNAYHTLQSIQFVLPNGSVYDTARKEDYERFEEESSSLHHHLLSIRESIKNDSALTEKIRAKYLTKNTVGYGLNSFLDFFHPLDIFAHLLIGSEGTLGFISEAVLCTVPDYPFKATVLLYFKTIHEACSAIIPLRDSGAEALELMDRAAIRSIEATPGIPVEILTLPENSAALLCEYQAMTAAELEALIHRGQDVFKTLQLLHQPSFTRDVYAQALLWKLRKGMFPSVGAVRAQGTTVILEDVAFPLESLADAVVDVQQLFVKHDYENGIIFGHAKDGNIHFVVSQSFNGAHAILKYESFMEDVVSLVVKKYKGTLKAEHGTGRNMAPFVETEWGKEAYQIMKSIKEVADPDQLLNPGVIINNDPDAHLKNIKSLPVVEAEVDKCIECGYCEHRCPSRDITMTPRQRIVVRREMERLKQNGNDTLLQEVFADYKYDGMETCAVDGLCATECPVNINTGDLIKKLRKENHSAFQNRMANTVARNFRIAETSTTMLLKFGKWINKVLGEGTMHKVTKSLRKFLAFMPAWPEGLEGPSQPTQHQISSPDILYFPTCISRMMGASAAGKKSVSEIFMELSARAGLKVQASAMEGLCCGQAFSSKGFQQAASEVANVAISKLWEMTEGGKIPVVMDITSCTFTLQQSEKFLSKENAEKLKALKILDSIEFGWEFLLPKLNITKPKNKVVLHPVCTLSKMKLNTLFEKVAAKCANEVVTPVHAGCCGMAGDRGFFFPELTAAAAAEESKEVSACSYDGYYSSAKTCEISLAQATGKNYESILYLLEEVSEPIKT